MVFSKHIDYNNSCTRVFRMCLMVIDMCIDQTLGILGQFTLKRVHAEDAGGRGQKIGVSNQEFATVGYKRIVMRRLYATSTLEDFPFRYFQPEIGR